MLFTLAVFCFVEDCVVYLWIAEHLRFPSNTNACPWYKWSHFYSATQLIRCGIKSWYRILPVVISKNIINLHPRKSLGFSSLWWPMNLYSLCARTGHSHRRWKTISSELELAAVYITAGADRIDRNLDRSLCLGFRNPHKSTISFWWSYVC